MCYRAGSVEKREETETDSACIVFCMDISESMGQKVGQDGTRLTCVKRAIMDEIRRINVEKKKCSVGLITFGSTVTFINHNA
jgi:hypothetical protein